MLIESSIGRLPRLLQLPELVVVAMQRVLQGLDQPIDRLLPLGRSPSASACSASNELRARLRNASLFCLRASPDSAWKIPSIPAGPDPAAFAGRQAAWSCLRSSFQPPRAPAARRTRLDARRVSPAVRDRVVFAIHPPWLPPDASRPVAGWIPIDRREKPPRSSPIPRPASEATISFMSSASPTGVTATRISNACDEKTKSG